MCNFACSNHVVRKRLQRPAVSLWMPGKQRHSLQRMAQQQYTLGSRLGHRLQPQARQMSRLGRMVLTLLPRTS